MRIVLVILAVLVVGLGGLYVAGAAQPDLPVAGATAQALQAMAGAAPAEGAEEGEAQPGFFARLGNMKVVAAGIRRHSSVILSWWRGRSCDRSG